MYFTNFKTLYSVFNINGVNEAKPIIDITTNVRMIKETLESVTEYEMYRIQDGDTPEIVAFKAYNSTDMHWMIMIANDIVDYQTDWPLSNQTFDDYVFEKYNKFQATEWTYNGDLITATVPGHQIVVTEPEDVIVENLYVTHNGQDTSTPPLNGVLRLIDADISTGTVTLRARGLIYGDPVTGFTLYTTNREFKTVHHYENNGLVTYDQDPEAIAVSCYDYEVQINESKREIKLIDKLTAANLNKQLGGLLQQ